MLGDSSGEFEGMIVTMQTFQFSIGMNFPLEPFCYFQLVFPDNLKLESNVGSVSGTGIFQPYSLSEEMNTGANS